jgi:hypothetical protein
VKEAKALKDITVKKGEVSLREYNAKFYKYIKAPQNNRPEVWPGNLRVK